MKKMYLTLLLLLIASFGNAWEPKDGYVPDEKTANKIAEAILFPIYGEELIRSEEPFVIHLKKGVWFIDGKPLAKHYVGGVVHIEISKKDARVLFVIHEQ
jgi:hypothetical protein